MRRRWRSSELVDRPEKPAELKAEKAEAKEVAKAKDESVKAKPKTKAAPRAEAKKAKAPTAPEAARPGKRSTKGKSEK